MSIVVNNSTFYFSKNISLEEAYKRADSILAAIAMVRNSFDLMRVKVYSNNMWELLE